MAEITPKTRKAWRGWLQKHHATSPGVWLLFAKKQSGLPTPSYSDAVEEALCVGWIDSVVHPVDGTFYKQLFTPRKPRSAWAQTNKARVARLIAAGLMMPAGLAAIEAARANGSWDALAAAEQLVMPPALRKALAANPVAKKHWAAFTASQQRQYLFYVTSAKREETRARRIATIVDYAERRITPSKAQQRPAATRTTKGSATKNTKITK